MKTMLTIILLFFPPLTFAPVFNQQAREESNKEYKVLKKVLMVNRIANTFKEIESSNRYHVKGESGEYGAFQFLPATFYNYCKEFYVELSITNPQHQDSLAKLKIIYLLDKGYSLDQIASVWNSGSPNYEGRIGINKHGVKYDTPAYVRKFNKVYESI